MFFIVNILFVYVICCFCIIFVKVYFFFNIKEFLLVIFLFMIGVFVKRIVLMSFEGSEDKNMRRLIFILFVCGRN